MMNINISNPRKLFVIDGFGALLSAFLLGVVLVKYEWFFGIPKMTLYFLALLPCLFAIYDLFCYYSEERYIARRLKVIAFINISYCLLSFVLAVYHIDVISWYGWVYIIIEIFIVIFLANIQLKVSEKLIN